mgnify:CR=1 FL=1
MVKYKLGTIEEHHVEFIRRMRNEQMSILRQFKPIDYNEQKEYFSNIHKDNRQILFSILDVNSEERCIGYCGLTNINYVCGTAEVSFITEETNDLESYKSILFFVLGELAKYAFDSLNLNKLWTETYDFRDNHISVLESFGMSREGALREHVYHAGKYHASIIHSILEREYDR